MIEVDRISTWPEALRRWCESVSEPLRGATGQIESLAVSYELDDDLHALLDGHAVGAYHCTRLLPHEVEQVRRYGLRLLDEQLVVDRLDRAAQVGAIASDLHAALVEQHAFAIDNAISAREGRVCFALSRTMLDDDVSGLSPFLTNWGGEAIYMALPRDLRQRSAIGTPVVVVCALDLAARTHLCFPRLTNVFLGAFLGLDRLQSEVHYKAAVPASAVVAIWQPGNPEYDRHAELPRT